MLIVLGFLAGKTSLRRIVKWAKRNKCQGQQFFIDYTGDPGKCGKRRNTIFQIQVLFQFELLDITGSTITIDAIGATEAILSMIDEKDGLHR